MNVEKNGNFEKMEILEKKNKILRFYTRFRLLQKENAEFGGKIQIKKKKNWKFVYFQVKIGEYEIFFGSYQNICICGCLSNQ